METIFSHYLLLWKPVAYLILFSGMIFEGDVILFTAAFLAHQGLLRWDEMLFVTGSGLVFGEFAWYWAGKKLHETSRLYRWAMRLAAPFDKQLTDRPIHTMVISKFVYGLGHIMVMRAAALGMDSKRFFKIDLFATLFWFVLVAGLGYLAGESIDRIQHSFRFAEIGLLVGLVVLLVTQGVVTYAIKRSKQE